MILVNSHVTIGALIHRSICLAVKSSWGDKNLSAMLNILEDNLNSL